MRFPSHRLARGVLASSASLAAGLSLRRPLASASPSAGAGAGAAAAAAAASPPESALPLRFLAAATCLAHPEKARGEDAYFISARALGVADGVGGWAEKGIDAGEYSRALMAEAQRACEDLLAAQGAPPSPAAAVRAAHRAVRLPGSSTATLLVAGAAGALSTYNLGDGGAQLWRRARVLAAPMPLSLAEAGRLWSCDHETQPTTHGFNFPAQLAADAEISDLVVGPKALQSQWRASGGELLLLATDGVWDNLSAQDIRGILARFDFAPCHAYARLQRAKLAAAVASGGGGGGRGIGEGGQGKLLETRYPLAPPEPVSELELKDRERLCAGQLAGISAALAVAAQRAGADERADTPFSRAATRAGFRFNGGKLDDSTVVAALVTADPEAADVYAQAP
jgi:protein phosphatase PTC7